MRNIRFTETVLRDANQSLIATRLPLNKFESVLSVMDQAGYYSIECWGGATFDSCLRYLHEDPWERLKVLKENLPNTKLQMLLRGQSLLGYKHYPDDVVRRFVNKSIENGIDIIRIFDALNDIDNIVVAVDETLKSGGHPSCAFSYTVSPVHSIKKYIELAKNMEQIGAKSICIKDMAGILTPDVAYKLVSELKQQISVPIILHSHCSTGLAYMSYLKAIEAGVDVIDTAISSFSGGTSQPATEVMVKAVMGLGYQTDIKDEQIKKVNEHFRKVYKEFADNGAIDLKIMSTDPRTLENQIPGGMYSNLISQMKAQNIFDRFDEVLKEIPCVRKDLGYPPLVTPISQMVGTQAIMNVLNGERYKTILIEVKDYLSGKYGKPSGDVDKELMMKVVGKIKFPNYRYSKELPYIYEETKEKFQEKDYTSEDILTFILFPELAKKYYEYRDEMNNEDVFIYKVIEARNASNINNEEIKPMEVLDEKIKAVMIAILSKTLKKSTSNIKIKSIYEI